MLMEPSPSPPWVWWSTCKILRAHMELRYNLGLLTFHRVTVRRAVDVTSERKVLV